MVWLSSKPFSLNSMHATERSGIFKSLLSIPRQISRRGCNNFRFLQSNNNRAINWKSLLTSSHRHLVSFTILSHTWHYDNLKASPLYPKHTWYHQITFHIFSNFAWHKLRILDALRLTELCWPLSAAVQRPTPVYYMAVGRCLAGGLRLESPILMEHRKDFRISYFAVLP